MSEPMSSLEIEDVLASIRRLVSDDLRPAANRPNPVGKLLLTPALRVVPPVGVVDAADAPLDRPVAALREGWVPDQSTLAAVTDEDADHLDFATTAAASLARAPARTAMQTAAEAFHAQTDEFVLSYSDTGTVMLRGDAPTPDAPADHAAVFAVLNKARSGGDVAPVQVLVDAEGGAPVDDDAAWSTVEWDDAADTADPSPKAEVLAEASTTDGPLILPFVSARRSGAAQSGDVLTLHSPVVQVMSADENRATEDTPVEKLVLQRKPKMKPKHMARLDAAQKDAEADPGTLAAESADIAAASSHALQTMADATPAEAALQAMIDRDLPADPSAEGAEMAIAAEQGPDLSGLSSAAIAAEEIAPGLAAADTAKDADVVANESAADTAAPLKVTKARIDLTEDAGTPIDDALATTLQVSGTRVKAPSRMTDAAFTRWPGWAQPDPGQIAAADLAPPEPPAAPVPVAKASQRKPKAAVQDLGWADRAEAEIHRQLAAELGTSVVGEVPAPASGLALPQLSEAALRDLVRDMIREELTGKLGERITQNVRKLVQMELQKTLALNMGEFRSQRRDPD
jgi:hypothetical protein